MPFIEKLWFVYFGEILPKLRDAELAKYTDPNSEEGKRRKKLFELVNHGSVPRMTSRWPAHGHYHTYTHVNRIWATPSSIKVKRALEFFSSSDDEEFLKLEFPVDNLPAAITAELDKDANTREESAEVQRSPVLTPGMVPVMQTLALCASVESMQSEVGEPGAGPSASGSTLPVNSADADIIAKVSVVGNEHETDTFILESTSTLDSSVNDSIYRPRI